jgi:hypothetical protein
MKEKLFLDYQCKQPTTQSNKEVKDFFYLMLTKQKGKITTSKDQENFWPMRRLQRVTDNNTQADERRLSHLSKNPMKEKKLRKTF